MGARDEERRAYLPAGVVEAPSGRNMKDCESTNSLPLVDPSVLGRLHDEVELQEGICTLLVQNFIGCLPTRINTLRMALTTGDRNGALNAALSLKTSSQMVGAERLASLALHLENSLRDNPLADPALSLPRLATTHFQRIKHCSLHTHDRFQPYVQRRAALSS